MGLKHSYEGIKALLKGRTPEFWSIFMIWIRIQDSKISADPDPQQFVMYSYIYFTSIFVRNRWDKLLFAPLDQGKLKWGSINKAVNEIINPHPGRVGGTFSSLKIWLALPVLCSF
jgi:hypothetical protein